MEMEDLQKQHDKLLEDNNKMKVDLEKAMLEKKEGNKIGIEGLQARIEELAKENQTQKEENLKGNRQCLV